VLFRKDINRVQHYQKVWGKVDPPPYFARYTASYHEFLAAVMLGNPKYPYYVLDTEPKFMGLDLQEEEAAGTIQTLAALEFLCRPAVSEGAVSKEVISLSIGDALRDSETGQYQFPDPDQDAALIAQMQQELAARSGIPLTDILKEQEARLNSDTSQNPQRTHTVPDGRHPAQHKRKSDPSLPTLNEDQLELLTFLIDNPDSPVNVVYKEVGIRAATVTQIRNELLAHGLLVDLEVRTGRSGAGRPTKFLLPTVRAFELLGKDPPTGRGGMLHRAIQHAVQAGAIAKGYSTNVEYPLRSGAIVDVHLEKGGGEKIAVEIAVMSHPSREMAHFRQCLSAGYDKVFGLFVDEHLRARTQDAIGKEFSVDDAAKVRLLPLSHLSQLG
jgi:hypothetical protein